MYSPVLLLGAVFAILGFSVSPVNGFSQAQLEATQIQCKCSNSSVIHPSEAPGNSPEEDCRNGKSKGPIGHVFSCVLMEIETIAQGVHEMICSITDYVFEVIFRIIHNIYQIANLFFVAFHSARNGQSDDAANILEKIRNISKENADLITTTINQIVSTAEEQTRIHAHAQASRNFETASTSIRNIEAAAKAFTLLDACAQVTMKLNRFIEEEFDTQLGVHLPIRQTLYTALEARSVNN